MKNAMNKKYGGIRSVPVNKLEVSVKENVSYNTNGTVNTSLDVKEDSTEDSDDDDDDSSDYVDLGLPSGIKWAKYNVGASSETDSGLYFPFREFHIDIRLNKQWPCWVGHNHNTGESIRFQNSTYLRVPTKEEFEELYNNTTSEIITINGVLGCKLTAQNGNYIFLPFCGYYNESFNAVGERGYYWSESSSNNNKSWYFYVGLPIDITNQPLGFMDTFDYSFELNIRCVKDT